MAVFMACRQHAANRCHHPEMLLILLRPNVLPLLNQWHHSMYTKCKLSKFYFVFQWLLACLELQKSADGRKSVQTLTRWIMAFLPLCQFTAWLFRPLAFAHWLVHPLACSPPSPRWIYLWFIIEACVCVSIYRKTTKVTDRWRTTTILIARPLLKYGRLKMRITSPSHITRWWYVCKPHHRPHSDHAKCVWSQLAGIRRTLCVNVKLPLKWILTGILGSRPNNRLTNAYRSTDSVRHHCRILRWESVLKLCVIKCVYRPNDFISKLNKALNIYTIVYSHYRA